MDTPIIDFHCDLLAYVANVKNATAKDPQSNCSVLQMEQANVHLQVLPIFTETHLGSTKEGRAQIEKFFSLPASNAHYHLAIENCSSLIDEHEPLDNFFSRINLIPKPIYISLTWKEENRFGGGDTTNIGLKHDGTQLLQFLDGKGIAIDLSHASDKLAYDIIDEIDRNNLDITCIASHSNVRAVHPAKRNLPDAIIHEIIDRGGVIGLNLVRYFVGDQIEDILDHISHLINNQGKQHIVLGADFFGGFETSSLGLQPPFFFEEVSNIGQVPHVLRLIFEEFGEETMEHIAYKNALNFFERQNRAVQTISRVKK